MPKISKITPSVAKSIDEDITAAVKSVEKKWGVNISIGGGTYDSDSFTSKVKVSLEGVDTRVQRKKIELARQKIIKRGIKI